MSDADHGDRSSSVVYDVEDAVVAAARRQHAFQLVTQWFADPARLGGEVASKTVPPPRN